MSRPSTFHEAVIEYVHRERGPLSLAQIRKACGIKDPKTSRVIMTRLASMHFVTILREKAYGNKRWTITKRWPPAEESCQVVKDAYVELQVLRRVIKGGSR